LNRGAYGRTQDEEQALTLYIMPGFKDYQPLLKATADA